MRKRCSFDRARRTWIDLISIWLIASPSFLSCEIVKSDTERVFLQLYRHWAKNDQIFNTLCYIINLKLRFNTWLYSQKFNVYPQNEELSLFIFFYLNFESVLVLPKTAGSAQTNKSISFIWIVWSTLYVYLCLFVLNSYIDKLYIKIGFAKEIDWYHHCQQFLFEI